MPIPPISDSDLTAISPDVLDTWPPPNVRRRIEWLSALRLAYDGDGDATPSVRWCQTAAERYAEFLTSAIPSAGGVDYTVEVFNALVDMTRYGASLLWRDEGTINILDPRYWLPTEYGWIYIEPEVGGQGNVDTALVWYFTDGQLEIVRHGFAGYHIGDAIEDVSSGAAEDVVIALTLPTRGDWGTPIIEPGVAWQEAAQTRWLGVMSLSAKIERPYLAYRISDADAVELTGEDYDPEIADFDFVAQAKSASAVLQDFSDLETARLPNAVQDLSYVQPQTDASAIVDVIEELRREFESAVSITGLSDDASDGNMSGVGLRWKNAASYQATLSLMNQCRVAFEELLGPLLWEHPWNTMEEAVNDDGDVPSTPDPVANAV